jgi:periplasmic glucans biosynthesis protein
MMDFSRRDALSLLAVLGIAGPFAARADGLAFAAPKPFSFDRLIEDARRRAGEPYRPPRVMRTDILEKIDYDQHNDIRFRLDRAIPVNGGKARVALFHPGALFPLPVSINLVDGETSRELFYRADYFDMPEDSPARQLPADLGFAGFRVMGTESDRDWLAFLGYSYFRSSGELDQFGQSARALAIDVAMPTPEEFPRFTDFYFAPSSDGDLTIYCRLDSPRVTGALRMDMIRDGKVAMDITARYFAREDIARFGVAPLTSMFWFSEANRERGKDWRPEVHDTDGLAMWSGAGERLWRPLNNPDRVMTSSFLDDNPKGFGLMQRDRNFENYEDDGVFYEKRPSVWVEPKGVWGRGQVQLVEIPTDDEIHDNIVAYWLSDNPVRKGDAISLDYRLTWAKDEPYSSDVGKVIATRIGRGGIPGQPRPPGVYKIVVDFAGGPISTLAKQGEPVEAIVSASSGMISNVSCYSNKADDSWRALFDLRPENGDPCELRLFLRKNSVPLTETWLYQFLPVRRTG